MDDLLDPAAMCMAVGNVSFDDCDMLTWSLGCTGVFDPMTPPASSMARLEMTSLAFMLVWVRLPVCHTRSGKWAVSQALGDLVDAPTSISSASLGSSIPRSTLVRAEASLRIPKARIIRRTSSASPEVEMHEESRLGTQYRSAGTSMGPIESVSVLVALTRSPPAAKLPLPAVIRNEHRLDAAPRVGSWISGPLAPGMPHCRERECLIVKK